MGVSGGRECVGGSVSGSEWRGECVRRMSGSEWRKRQCVRGSVSGSEWRGILALALSPPQFTPAHLPSHTLSPPPLTLPLVHCLPLHPLPPTLPCAHSHPTLRVSGSKWRVRVCAQGRMRGSG